MTRLSRLPPAVSYPLRRSVVPGVLLVAALCWGLGVLIGWMLQGLREAGALVVIAFALWCATAAAASHWWWRQCCGSLRWDGCYWHLDDTRGADRSQALSAAPEVILDLQSHLWVRISPVGLRSLWLWLERSRQPERWMDLRRAVYSRATPGADNADKTALVRRPEA